MKIEKLRRILALKKFKWNPQVQLQPIQLQGRAIVRREWELKLVSVSRTSLASKPKGEPTKNTTVFIYTDLFSLTIVANKHMELNTVLFTL